MFGALLINLAVIAAPPVAADVTQTSCATVHCATTVSKIAKTEDCAGVHCGPAADKNAGSDTRYGGANMDSGHDSAGLDSRNGRYGESGIDRGFDNRHDASFDREGFDKSGIWPAQ